MASSDNLASIEPWTLRPCFTDSFFPEIFSCDYEALTKALQKSLSGSTPSDAVSPFLNLVNPDNTPSSTVSDQETAPKRQRSTVLSATGKVSKRKSRAFKRSQTTFIEADPMNFRQMVQQVTGGRLGNSQMPMAPVLKPEPHRPRSWLQSGDLFLPTLDTSSFLLDHQQQKEEPVGSTSAAGAAISGPDPLAFEPPVAVVDAGLDSPALEFDAYLNFPTLESWKVM